MKVIEYCISVFYMITFDWHWYIGSLNAMYLLQKWKKNSFYNKQNCCHITLAGPYCGLVRGSFIYTKILCASEAHVK